MKKSIIIGLIIAVVAILVDQISKLAMLTLFEKEHDFLVVIPNFFKLYLQFNPYIAFSIKLPFEGQMIATAVAVIIFAVMARWADFSKNPFYAWGTYLMIGGMCGNFLDRIFNPEGVIDFLSFTFFGKPFATFNIADSCLVVGVICVIIDLLFFDGKREKTKLNTEE